MLLQVSAVPARQKGELVINKYEKSIVKTLNEIHTHNTLEAFSDFVEISALLIWNHVASGKNKEKAKAEYINKINLYNEAEQETYKKMLGELVSSIKEHVDRREITDILGNIFSKLDLGSSRKGQFFTPASLADLLAGSCLNREHLTDEILKRGFVTLEEPSCGGGGLLTAFCQKMLNEGVNPQEHLVIHASDIDRKCVCMTYLQLSIYGIPAIVTHGDALTNKMYGACWYTPAYKEGMWQLRENGGVIQW